MKRVASTKSGIVGVDVRSWLAVVAVLLAFSLVVPSGLASADPDVPSPTPVIPVEPIVVPPAANPAPVVVPPVAAPAVPAPADPAAPVAPADPVVPAAPVAPVLPVVVPQVPAVPVPVAPAAPPPVVESSAPVAPVVPEIEPPVLPAQVDLGTPAPPAAPTPAVEAPNPVVRAPEPQGVNPPVVRVEQPNLTPAPNPAGEGVPAVSEGASANEDSTKSPPAPEAPEISAADPRRTVGQEELKPEQGGADPAEGSTSGTSTSKAPEPQEVKVPEDEESAVSAEPEVKPLEKPDIPQEVFNMAPVVKTAERVNVRGNEDGNDDQDGRDGSPRNSDDDDDSPGPGRGHHDNPPWGGHGDGNDNDDNDGDHDGPGGHHGDDDDHDGPPPRPPVDIDHDDHGNVIITNNFINVINQINVNGPVAGIASQAFLTHWGTGTVFRVALDIRGRVVLNPGWCGGLEGGFSVTGGISGPGFSAYGSAGMFFAAGAGCGYVPPPPLPYGYPQSLPMCMQGGCSAPVNYGPYYIPSPDCGCVYLPNHNTYMGGTWQPGYQGFVPTQYQYNVFEQPRQGPPPWSWPNGGLDPKEATVAIGSFDTGLNRDELLLRGGILFIAVALLAGAGLAWSARRKAASPQGPQ